MPRPACALCGTHTTRIQGPAKLWETGHPDYPAHHVLHLDICTRCNRARGQLDPAHHCNTDTIDIPLDRAVMRYPTPPTTKVPQ